MKEGGAKLICYEVMKEGRGERRLEYIIHTALLISIPMLVLLLWGGGGGGGGGGGEDEGA